MKTAAYVFVALFVGALASPALPEFDDQESEIGLTVRNERIVTGQIVEAIENLSRQIREAGMDPWNVDVAASYELPVAVLFNAKGVVDDLVLTGLSNIIVQSINYSLLQNRLTFNIVLPRLGLTIGNTKARAVLFGERYEASAAGSLTISNIRLIGDIRVNVGIISGISIRSITLNFSLGGIDSRLNLNLLGRDVSARINTLLGSRIPATLAEFSREINELLEIVAREIIEENLNRRSLW